MTDQVNEGTTAYLVVDFLDKAGAPSVPSAITYRIDCRATGTQVRGDTSLTPAAEVEIELTPSDTDIIGVGNDTEVKRVTIKATFGLGGAANSEFDYEVVNLSGVT